MDMETLLFYLLRISIAAAVIYGCYKIFISKTTFYKANRTILLGVFVLTLILPLFSITLPEINWFRQPETGITDLSLLENVTVDNTIPATAPAKPIPWQNILLIAYLAGFIFCLLRYAAGMVRMMYIIRSAEKIQLPEGNTLYVTGRDIAPFSWMKFIIISGKSFRDENTDIIRHEQAHVAHRHSIDLMLADMYCIAFWFNPFAWLLRRELRDVHEYQADAAVVENRSDYREYQLLLIRHCVGEHKFSVANNFEFNNLQKRIKMIMRTKSSNKTKWLYSSLIFGGLLAVAILSVNTLQAKTPLEVNITEKSSSATDALKGKINEIKIVGIKAGANPDVRVDGKNVVVLGKKTKKDGITETVEVNTDSEKPLFIVDGTQVNSIDQINSNDIESISVLKDKSATAIYGEKGKNGVILVTTKKTAKLNEIKDPANSTVSENQTVARDTVKIRRKIITNSKGEKQEVHIAKQNDFLQNPPLFILEDKEITYEQMNNIAKDDIQSVTVLKDKSSTDIYGEKGKNGVVIIHLKESGKSPK